MRIAIIDFEENILEEDKETLFNVLNNSYKECIFFDIFSNDIEEADYCLDIRMYDLIFINYLSKNSRNYFNLMKTINSSYKLEHRVFIFNNPVEKKNFDFFQSRIKEIYKQVNPEYCGSFYSQNNIISKIIEKTEEVFLTIPIVDNIEINHENKVVTIQTTHGEVVLEIKKNIDFQILLYFMRHYGEVININSILSAITQEPEFMNNSPIESSISSIRKIFKLALDTNPITAFKRVGYQFKM